MSRRFYPPTMHSGRNDRWRLVDDGRTCTVYVQDVQRRAWGSTTVGNTISRQMIALAVWDARRVVAWFTRPAS